jgi:peptidyl-prolyl cis-trans isomerase C
MTMRSNISPWAAAFAVLSLVAATGCGGSHDAGTPKEPEPGVAATASTPGSPAPAAVPVAGADATPTAETESPVPKGVDPKKTVATVNGAAITADRAYSIYDMNKAMLRQRGHVLNDSEDQALRASTLQNLIAEELLFQGANAAGVKVAAPEIDAKIKDLRTRAGSDENFKKMMEGAGLTEPEVRAEIERSLKTQAYEKTIAESKGVTEDVAKKFYDGNKDMFKTPEQAHVQLILLKATDTDPDSVKAEAKARAQEAQKKGASGADFAALAKQYSQDATAAKGGDIGFFPKGVMFPRFEELAFSLPPGTVSPVFETPKGFNVVKVIERKPESIRPFAEVKDALMLDMGRALGRKLVQDKVSELAAKAKIDVLDPAFSTQQAAALATAAAAGGAAGDAKKP